MRPRHSLLLSLALASLSCNDAPSSAPRADGPFAEVDESFEIVEGWAAPPSGGAFGRVLGVAVAPDGRVWVSHTADGEARNEEPIPGATLAALDPATGAIVEEKGRGRFRLPHAIAFDGTGRLWVIDADADRIEVIDPRDEKLLLEIGVE